MLLAFGRLVGGYVKDVAFALQFAVRSWWLEYSILRFTFGGEA